MFLHCRRKKDNCRYQLVASKDDNCNDYVIMYKYVIIYSTCKVLYRKMTSVMMLPTSECRKFESLQLEVIFLYYHCCIRVNYVKINRKLLEKYDKFKSIHSIIYNYV